MTATASLQSLRPCKLDSIVPFRTCLTGRVNNSVCSVVSAMKRHRGHMKTLARGSSGGSTDIIGEWIENEIPGAGRVTGRSGMGGSGWATAARYDTDSGMKFFVKQARGESDGMFKGEALGLQALYDTHTLRIPKIYHHGALSDGTFIVMEYLDFGGRGSQGDLGDRLARMHLAPPQDPQAAEGHFGFPVDNTIGGTPQYNGWMNNWVEFFRERRLRPQLEMAQNQELSRLGDVLMRNLDSLFEGVEVTPCCLHGDLWSGNIATADGQPSVFDPAVYFGHSEAEFGMSWCAGFSGDFWRAYRRVIPKAQGFDERAKLYRLYHYLNHHNLFGGGYRGSAMSEMKSVTRDMK